MTRKKSDTKGPILETQISIAKGNYRNGTCKCSGKNMFLEIKKRE